MTITDARKRLTQIQDEMIATQREIRSLKKIIVSNYVPTLITALVGHIDISHGFEIINVPCPGCKAE